MRPQGCGFSRRRRVPWLPRTPRVVHLAVALALLAGCAGTTRPLRVAPRPARPHPGYDRLADRLSALDPGVFGARRIALEPVHGGLLPRSLGLTRPRGCARTTLRRR